jgi:hypothetical protein
MCGLSKISVLRLVKIKSRSSSQSAELHAKSIKSRPLATRATVPNYTIKPSKDSVRAPRWITIGAGEARWCDGLMVMRQYRVNSEHRARELNL